MCGLGATQSKALLGGSGVVITRVPLRVPLTISYKTWLFRVPCSGNTSRRSFGVKVSNKPPPIPTDDLEMFVYFSCPQAACAHTAVRAWMHMRMWTYVCVCICIYTHIGRRYWYAYSRIRALLTWHAFIPLSLCLDDVLWYDMIRYKTS